VLLGPFCAVAPAHAYGWATRFGPPKGQAERLARGLVRGSEKQPRVHVLSQVVRDIED
jgi:hypothetical protein